jgi:hypothetical protein
MCYILFGGISDARFTRAFEPQLSPRLTAGIYKGIADGELFPDARENRSLGLALACEFRHPPRAWGLGYWFGRFSAYLPFSVICGARIFCSFEGNPCNTIQPTLILSFPTHIFSSLSFGEHLVYHHHVITSLYAFCRAVGNHIDNNRGDR